MRGLSLGLGLAPTKGPPVTGGGPPTNLYPASPFANGSDWTQASGTLVAISNNKITLNGATSTDILSMTGSSILSSLNAALANDTAYTVEIDISGYVTGDRVRIAFKGGSVGGNVPISGNGTFSGPITTGTGSVHTVRGLSGTVFTYNIDAIRVYA